MNSNKRGEEIVPLEVKAEVSLKSKSLKAFCNKFDPGLAIRISGDDFIDQGWMINVPLWAISAI